MLLYPALASLTHHAERPRGGDIGAAAGYSPLQLQHVVAVEQFAGSHRQRDEGGARRPFEPDRARRGGGRALHRFEYRVESRGRTWIGHLKLQPDLVGISRNPQNVRAWTRLVSSLARRRKREDDGEMPRHPDLVAQCRVLPLHEL